MGCVCSDAVAAQGKCACLRLPPAPRWYSRNVSMFAGQISLLLSHMCSPVPETKIGHQIAELGEVC